MKPSQNVPRWILITVAVALILGGAAAAVSLMLVGLGGTKFERALGPGETRITIEKPGHYTLFHEYRTIWDDFYYQASRKIPPLDLKLVESKTGNAVVDKEDVLLTGGRMKGMRSRYSMGGRAGVSILKFTIARPGEHVLQSTYKDGKGPSIVFSISRGFGGRVLLVVLACLAIVGATVTPAVYLLKMGRLSRMSGEGTK